jgi:hypothetical protein
VLTLSGLWSASEAVAHKRRSRRSAGEPDVRERCGDAFFLAMLSVVPSASFAVVIRPVTPSKPDRPQTRTEARRTALEEIGGSG